MYQVKNFGRIFKAATNTQFEYAWCLVRSQYTADIRMGIRLLDELVQDKNETGKQDFLYYLAIGNARIKEYQTALQCIRVLLQVQPGNRQAQDLEQLIKKRMTVVGGATLAFGELVGVCIALAKRN